ncbi:hypothetical protein EYZ11_004051 [Aspergillus tanneri]|uniref:Uncharacterized protein n=1 Tax=Aspergillus tanneri TaxID=1220188 RepID=A0A4S3JM22_9EURO|nr:hypothetical protein EYZ11_004051 [Aspergillus tanneri]
MAFLDGIDSIKQSGWVKKNLREFNTQHQALIKELMKPVQVFVNLVLSATSIDYVSEKRGKSRNTLTLTIMIAFLHLNWVKADT